MLIYLCLPQLYINKSIVSKHKADIGSNITIISDRIRVIDAGDEPGVVTIPDNSTIWYKIIYKYDNIVFAY